jgi:hypothetical protein
MNKDSEIKYLRSPQAIRERCQAVLDFALRSADSHFEVRLDQLDACADYVTQVIREAYPDNKIPPHSRWGHFDVGGIPRLQQLDDLLAKLSPAERARTKFDLAITSVLLDAGAGPDWRYEEGSSHRTFVRSEGLAVASFHMFCEGAFSSDASNRFQADAVGLQKLSEQALARGFQVSDHNPLEGVEGRVQLLNNLGKAVANHPEFFGTSPARPGNLFDYLAKRAENQSIPAQLILESLLESLSDIWPGRISRHNTPLGDVWPYPALSEHEFEHLVPFHKLSQWLSYSLLEPLEEAGIKVRGLNELTGLAEYRNGGLFLDSGVLVPRAASLLTEAHEASSTVIVEWRALTVALLDRLADKIRTNLNTDAETLPLVKILQGGTWSAGRKIAKEKRLDGSPPLQLKSDGTVF